MRVSATALLVVISVIGLTVACSDDESSTPAEDVTATMRIAGTYGDEPLMMFNRTYDYTDDMRFSLQLFQFYVSDVTLLRNEKNSTDSIKLLDIGLVSFENVLSASKADEGLTLNLAKVEAGTYDGISFGVGVSPRMNATQPGDYTPPHPLDDHYWSWARGYVFSKIEGNADLDGDGTMEEKLTYHIGENSQYRTYTVNAPIDISADDAEIALAVDFKKVLFDEADNYLNFRESPIDHTNDMDLANFISDNLVRSITLQ